MDRGYIDFERLYTMHQHKAFFVTRAKNNFQFKQIDKSTGIITQVYIAIITYALVAVIKSKLKTNHSTYEILYILSASFFDKT